MNHRGWANNLAPGVTIGHPNDLEPGDRLRLGKRLWVYAGRSEHFPEYEYQQSEYVFDADHESPGACGQRRVHSQSELEALIAAGFMYRIKECRLCIENTSGAEGDVPQNDSETPSLGVSSTSGGSL